MSLPTSVAATPAAESAALAAARRVVPPEEPSATLRSELAVEEGSASATGKRRQRRGKRGAEASARARRWQPQQGEGAPEDLEEEEEKPQVVVRAKLETAEVGREGGAEEKETITQAADRVRSALGRDAYVVCVLGGTDFRNASSKVLVEAIAAKLCAVVDSKAKFVTGGMPGVQEAFAKQCGDGSRVWNLLPTGQRSSFGRGTDINAGTNLEERKAIFGLIGDFYITVEGGPGVSQEARMAHTRGAAVVPLRRTGGASEGMFDFPHGALQKPDFASEEQWSLLASNDAPIDESATALSAILETCAAAMGQGRDEVEPQHEQPAAPKSQTVQSFKSCISEMVVEEGTPALADSALATSAPSPVERSVAASETTARAASSPLLEWARAVKARAAGVCGAVAGKAASAYQAAAGHAATASSCLRGSLAARAAAVKAAVLSVVETSTDKAQALAHSAASLALARLPEPAREQACLAAEVVNVRMGMLGDTVKTHVQCAKEYSCEKAVLAEQRLEALKSSVSSNIDHGRAKAHIVATEVGTQIAARVPEPVSRKASEVADYTTAKYEMAKAKASDLAADPDIRTAAKAAVGGAVAVGASGGAVGATAGSAIGAAVGVVPAIFTFGLSIPICAAIGGGVGLSVGTAVGSTVGLVGGGAAGGVYAKRTEVCQTVTEAVSTANTYVSDTTKASKEFVSSKVATSTGFLSSAVARFRGQPAAAGTAAAC